MGKREQFEIEARKVLDKLNDDHEALYEKYKHEGGLDGHGAEHKELTHKAFEKIAKLKEKCGIRSK